MAKKEFWDKPNPKAEAGKSKKLTVAQKARAKRRAASKNRKWPNAIDNSWAVRTSKG